jgi:hypothetical protein
MSTSTNNNLSISPHEGELKKRILPNVMEDSWDDGEGGGYTTYRGNIIDILDEAKKDFPQSPFDNDVYEVVELMQQWFKKYFGVSP